MHYLRHSCHTDKCFVFNQQETVVVIGAGAAGLAAARHLNNFNHKVIVLEARNRIGGRVWDVDDKSTVVGRGAQIINGCINNPFMMMCEQVCVFLTL